MTDLFDTIGTKVSMSNYCWPLYWLWEDCIAASRLKELGYTMVTFHMGEQDSFGPLSRIVRCKKGGVSYEFVYG